MSKFVAADILAGVGGVTISAAMILTVALSSYAPAGKGWIGVAAIISWMAAVLLLVACATLVPL